MNKQCILCIFFITPLLSMEEQQQEVSIEPFSPRRFTKILQEKDPNAIFIAAIHERSIPKVKLCLDRETNDDHKYKECKAEDPYGVAWSIGTTEIVHEFIKHGYSVDQLISYETCTQSPRVKLPLEASKDQKHNRKKNKKLIERYKNIRRAVKGDNRTELQILLKKSFIDARFKDYRTALHVACLLHKADCARILLQAGANPNVHDAHRYSPLYLAVHNKARDYPRLLNLLKEYNADISYAQELATKDGDTQALETLQKLSINGNLSLQI